MRFNNKNMILPEPWVPAGPPNDEIWYTSSNGNIVAPYRTSSLPEIDTNTYSGGKGIIKFKTNITSIGTRAFQNCFGLASVVIPNSVTSIGTNAFWKCTGLTSVTIPNSVTSIEYYTFAECTSLTSITILNSVTSIGDRAFYECIGLTSISYTGTVAQYNAITKGSYWHYNVPATVVHCTNGDTPI